jgi:hypothetical protein
VDAWGIVRDHNQTKKGERKKKKETENENEQSPTERESQESSHFTLDAADRTKVKTFEIQSSKALPVDFRLPSGIVGRGGRKGDLHIGFCKLTG